MPNRLTNFTRSAIGNLRGNYNHLPQPPGRFIALDGPGLGGYYNDLTGKLFPGRWDEARIGAFMKSPQQRGYFSATAVAHMGLAWHDRYVERGADEPLANARSAADWLVADAVRRGSAAVWVHPECPVPCRDRNLECPWMSAMTQGEAISLLLRVHAAFGGDAYLETAHAAFEPFLRVVEDGGVAGRDADGEVFFEEVPHPAPYSHVLNGHIYALWGVFDLARYTGLESAAALYREAAASLDRTVERFDVGYWSRYDIYPRGLANVASPFYHALHVSLLEALAVTSGNPRFAALAERWRRYADSRPAALRATARKALYKALHG
jgi:hypothetical protein